MAQVFDHHAVAGEALDEGRGGHGGASSPPGFGGIKRIIRKPHHDVDGGCEIGGKVGLAGDADADAGVDHLAIEFDRNGTVADDGFAKGLQVFGGAATDPGGEFVPG